MSRELAVIERADGTQESVTYAVEHDQAGNVHAYDFRLEDGSPMVLRSGDTVRGIAAKGDGTTTVEGSA